MNNRHRYELYTRGQERLPTINLLSAIFGGQLVVIIFAVYKLMQE